MVLKLLSQVSVQELYNITVSTSEEVGLNEARDADNNIIISDSTLPNILPPQLKKMSVRYKVMGGWECFISTESMHYSLLRGRDSHLKKLKYQIHNAQNKRSGELENYVFEIYKNYVRPHGCNIHNTATEMEMETMCTCNYTHNGLLHWKCVLRCCERFPSIRIPSQDENRDTTNTYPTIIFHFYRNLSCCTVHVRSTY